MSKFCKCGNSIPSTIVVDSKRRNLKNRKFCFQCSPFGCHNTRNLTQPSSPRAEKFRRWQDKARRERRARLVALYGGRCEVCGYDKCAAALEFHHKAPDAKRFSLSKGNLLRPWEEVLAEAQKCTLLCANCHRELEDHLRALPEIISRLR